MTKKPILIPLSVVEHKISKLALKTSPFQKRILAEGDVVHVSVDLQFTVGRVKSANDGELLVEWDSPVYIREKIQPLQLLPNWIQNPELSALQL